MITHCGKLQDGDRGMFVIEGGIPKVRYDALRISRPDALITQVDFYWRGDHVFTHYAPMRLDVGGEALQITGLEGTVTMEFSQV
jgi:hypothetical protein